jgi:hypothetical protein
MGVDDRSSYRWRHPKSRPRGDDPRRAGQAPRSPSASSSSPHAWDWMSSRCWSSGSRNTNGHGDAGPVSHLGLLAQACGVVADRPGRMGHRGSGYDRQLAIHILRHHAGKPQAHGDRAGPERGGVCSRQQTSAPCLLARAGRAPAAGVTAPSVQNLTLSRQGGDAREFSIAPERRGGSVSIQTQSPPDVLPSDRGGTKFRRATEAVIRLMLSIT